MLNHKAANTSYKILHEHIFNRHFMANVDSLYNMADSLGQALSLYATEQVIQ